MKLSIANNIMFKKKSSIFGTTPRTHNLTSTNYACDFQISKGGSHDFLFQKVSASTGRSEVLQKAPILLTGIKRCLENQFIVFLRVAVLHRFYSKL